MTFTAYLVSGLVVGLLFGAHRLWEALRLVSSQYIWVRLRDWYYNDSEPWWRLPAHRQRAAMATPLCPMCNKPARQRCSLCKSVRYCSVKCQGEHWSYGHKEECRRGAVVAKKAAHRNGSLDACTAANGAALPAHEQQEEAPVPKQELFAYSGYLQLLRESQALDMPVPCGIRNTGNSCFAAAVLQCLLYTHPLPAFFSQRLHSQRCIRPKPQAWCALCALEALANAAYGQQEGGAISADSILQHIRKLGSHFAVGEQEDCHELLVQLQDAMQGIMLREAGGRERHPEVRTQETTLVHHIFSGYMRQQTICGSCGYVSKSFENTSALQLSIPPGVFDIEAALALDTKPEKLDEHNKWKCDHCKEHVHARRDLKVEIAPNVLQICLKRFTGYNGKIEKLIDFGETLDLTPFMACGAIDDQPVTYSLYGVITHIGRGSSTAFGHYICFVRTEPDNWFRCDDEAVEEVPVQAVLRSQAYMLFYQRDAPHIAPSKLAARVKAAAAALAAAAAAGDPAANSNGAAPAMEHASVANGGAAAVSAAAAGDLGASASVAGTADRLQSASLAAANEPWAGLESSSASGSASSFENFTDPSRLGDANAVFGHAHDVAAALLPTRSPDLAASHVSAGRTMHNSSLAMLALEAEKAAAKAAAESRMNGHAVHAEDAEASDEEAQPSDAANGHAVHAGLPAHAAGMEHWPSDDKENDYAASNRSTSPDVLDPPVPDCVTCAAHQVEDAPDASQQSSLVSSDLGSDLQHASNGGHANHVASPQEHSSGTSNSEQLELPQLLTTSQQYSQAQWQCDSDHAGPNMHSAPSSEQNSGLPDASMAAHVQNNSLQGQHSQQAQQEQQRPRFRHELVQGPDGRPAVAVVAVLPGARSSLDLDVHLNDEGTVLNATVAGQKQHALPLPSPVEPCHALKCRFTRSTSTLTVVLPVQQGNAVEAESCQAQNGVASLQGSSD